MTLFLTYLTASFLGSVLGGVSVYYFIGLLVFRQEVRKRAELEKKLQAQSRQVAEAIKREAERMRNYAEMEG